MSDVVFVVYAGAPSGVYAVRAIAIGAHVGMVGELPCIHVILVQDRIAVTKFLIVESEALGQ